MADQRYVICGGREGYERLRILHLMHRPGTSVLFDMIGLEPGMRCMDLGCVGGEVTFEMAARVGPMERRPDLTWTRSNSRSPVKRPCAAR